MKRLVIAVDCDDVLVVSTALIVDAYNTKHGTNVELIDAIDHDNFGLWGVDKLQLGQRMSAILKSDEYEQLGPSADAIRVLNGLAESHELHLVTARKPDERDVTQRMLDRDLPEVFASMELVGWDGSKGEVCRRIKADVLIDDKPDHLESAVEHGLPQSGAILFGDYPWQDRSAAPAGVVAVKDWSQVADYIDRLSHE